MATDATGTPTSPDSIPTYNVNTDDPTGNGFNAAMAVIQTALSARASKPSGIVSGEVPVWNGTTWVRSSTVHINNAGQPLPLITTSTIAGGPPASPTDGDIWIATAVDTNGTRWHFQYNAGSASASKWEFIGGPPIHVAAGSITTTSIAFVALTGGGTFTLPRSGDYWVDFGALIQQSSGFTTPYTGYVSAAIAGGTFGFDARNTLTVAGGQSSVTSVGSATTATLGQVIDIRVRVDQATATFFTFPWFEITPIRIA